MFTSSPGYHSQSQKSSKVRRIHVAALRVIQTKFLQVLKEFPEDHHKVLINAKNLQPLQVHLSKILSPRIIDLTDSDSLLIMMLVHLINENHLLNVPDYHQNNETDAEQI